MLLQILFFVAVLALLGVLVRQVREQYLPVIALAFVIACLPFNDVPYLIIGMLTMSVLIVLAFIINKSRRFTWHPMFYAIVVMYLLKIMGVINVGYLDFPTQRFDTAIPMLLFPILFSMVQLSKRNVILVLRFFLWIVIAVCVYGLLSYAITVYNFSLKAALLDGKSYSRFFIVWPITWQPSALSIMMLMALPVSFYLRYHDGKQITLVEMLLAVSLPILVTFMVGARIGVAVFPVLLGLSYLFYCKFKPIFKWSLVAIGAVAMSVTVLSLPSDIRERYSDQIRIDLRNTAISAIKEKPIFGWGTWQQRDLILCEERAQSLGIDKPHSQWHFHNLYLDTMVQFGIVGILVLMWLIFGIFWIATSKRHFLLLSFAMMYIMAFFFENVLHSSRWIVTFMFWFCFLIANWKYLVERTPTSTLEHR